MSEYYRLAQAIRADHKANDDAAVQARRNRWPRVEEAFLVLLDQRDTLRLHLGAALEALSGGRSDLALGFLREANEEIQSDIDDEYDLPPL